MPVGAIIGSTVVGVGGAIAGSSAQKKAAQQAAQTQQQTTESNNALAREMYNRNSANMQPYMQYGQRAGSVLDELLLGPRAQPQPLPGQGVLSGNGAYGSGGGALSAYGDYGYPETSEYGFGRGALSGYDYPQQSALGSYGSYGTTNALSPYAPQGALTGQAPAQQPNALSAWDQFRNGTNYQWRFNEGMKGLGASFAARGLAQSGAAAKAAIQYGQNFASNELNNYIGLLQGQQNMGMAGASALAGVGQNLVTNVSNNNQAGASALANSQLAAGNATANMWGNVSGALGTGAGMYSSYRLWK